MKEKRQDKFSKITRKESGLTESTKALISKMTNWFECFFGTGGRFPKLRIPRSGADLQVKHVTQKISKYFHQHHGALTQFLIVRDSEGLLERNTEAVLKAARLGDVPMLTQLHNEVRLGLKDKILKLAGLLFACN